ncbi:MAG: hypothetical protein AAGA03_06265 [Planctomycetota bacterium]
MTKTTEAKPGSDAVGVLFRPERVLACRAQRTLLGRVRYTQAQQALNGQSGTEATAALFKQLGLERRVVVPVAAALPTDECYFATRPIASGATNASPRVLLRESLRSASPRLDPMEIDVLNWQPDGRKVAGIVAAPTQRVVTVREGVEATGHLLRRLVPAACVVIQSASQDTSKERRGSLSRGGLTARVFLSDASLLAVMSRGGLAIQWQRFPLPAGDEATGIVAAIRSLEAAAPACGLDRLPDTFVIHGRTELRALIDQKWLSENLEGDIQWQPGPTLDDESVAENLATQMLGDQDTGFDLVRQYRAPQRLRRVVPHREILAYLAAAAVLLAVLWGRYSEVQRQRLALLTSAPPMIVEGVNTSNEQKRLNARAAAVSQFVDGRVHWSQMISSIADSLPNGTRLTDVRATSPINQKRKRQTKVTPTTLVLRGESILDDDGSMPDSLDQLTTTLREMPSVGAHFKSVELGDVRRTTSQETGVVGATFSLVLTSRTIKGR